MNENFVNARPFMLEQLRDPEVACGYLKLAFEDEDSRFFIGALNDVIEAFCGKENALYESKLSREMLLRMLQAAQDPIIGIKNMLTALGFSVSLDHKERI